MHLPLMPVLLYLGPKPVEALLEGADEWVVPLVCLLLLLPLQLVLLGPMLVHLSREDAAPPDTQLVLTQLTLQAPLLCVGTPSVVLDLSLLVRGPVAVWPGAGVANVEMDTFNVFLPVDSLAKALITVLTSEGSNLFMDSCDVRSQMLLSAKLHPTLGTLELLLLLVDSLEMLVLRT